MSRSVRQLNIGPVRFGLEGEGSSAVEYSGWAYRHFFSRNAAEGNSRPLVEMSVELVAAGLEMPSDTPYYECGSNWAVWPDGEGWLFCSRYAGRERPLFSCRVSKDLDRATLYVDGGLSDAPLRYPLDQVLTWGLLARCGGVLMHSAIAVRDGQALVFAGRSGAGKSTLSALCRAEGWRILNDDRVIVFQRDGEPRAAGTPWHGSGCFAEADEVRPAGIFLLTQSDTERLERVPPQTAKLELLDVTSIPWFEDDWSQGALDALDALVETVPVYRFYFTNTPSAARALALFQEVPA
jgi:hypothetical protein